MEEKKKKKKKYPVVRNSYNEKMNRNINTKFCFAYQDDLDDAYAFYCSRYENISYEEFMKLGLFEFKKKLGSIPKNEPLFDKIKARAIKLSEIKDKEEKNYWQKMKRLHEIPQIYLSNQEIDAMLNNFAKNNKLGG